ncbi:MbtH family protein [Amycolatopsis sp. NPDC051758]|uniref:MbtH family protein n=1 Tax=Amycolatopsis sp. NPDC051758 TaxID=3363935 RepID=UPI00378FA315
MNDEDTRAHLVVRNDEEQYSIWLAGRELPAGWYPAGAEGTRAECLEHIAEVWTDMRPLSLRKRMAAQETVTAGEQGH